MSEFNQDMLGDMAIEALERTAFVSAEPADSEFLDELDQSEWYTRIKYSGPVSGAVYLAGSPGFMLGLASSLLGVEIEDVRIMRLDLPEEVSESVYERMRSERQEVIRTLRAQGDAAAQEIRSDAERERTIILADAYSQGQVIRGEGDAPRGRTLCQRISGQPDVLQLLSQPAALS